MLPAGEDLGPGGDSRMSLIFASHFRGYNIAGFARFVVDPIPSDGERKGDL